jgi:hypothetical protein
VAQKLDYEAEAQSQKYQPPVDLAKLSGKLNEHAISDVYLLLDQQLQSHLIYIIDFETILSGVGS